MDLIKPLLTLSYWFGNGIQPFHPLVGRLILIFMAGLVLVGIALVTYLKFQKGMEKHVRRVWMRVATLDIVMGLIGLLLYWFHYEGIPMLSMRFWYLVWLAVVGWWKYDIWNEYQKVKATFVVDEERAKYEKWLPKPKH